MIIFRLLGKTPCYEIQMKGTGTLNLDKIIEIFLHQQYPKMMKACSEISKLSEEERNIKVDKNPDIKAKLEKFQGEKDEFVSIMRQVKFIHNGKMVTMEEEIKILNESQDYIICVFAQPDKEKVSGFVDMFFKAKGKIKVKGQNNDLSNNTMVGSLDPKVVEPKVLSEEKKKERFDDFKRKIEDDDFCTLLRIYLNKPELIPALLAYVESGDIEIKKDKVLISEKDFKKEYAEQIETLKILELPFSDEDILEILIFREGDVSLTLRDLIVGKANGKKKSESASASASVSNEGDAI
jgi:hypothetical protein